MTCPRCHAANAPGAIECAGCGVILARARASGPSRAPLARQQSTAAPRPPEGLWKAAATGLVAALLLPRFPFAHFLLTPLATLVHEIGHAAFGWLFGYPSLPAFDFAGGGGLTTHGERSNLILLAWGAGAAGGAWAWPGLPRWTALGSIAIWGVMLWRGWDEWLTVGGGHLFEVLFGGVFLYRGLTGWGARAPGERPLSCFVGFFLLFHVVTFASGLVSDAGARAVYQQGKAGIDHDLVTLANYTWLRLSTLASLLALMAVATIPVTFLAATRHRQALRALGHDDEDFED